MPSNATTSNKQSTKNINTLFLLILTISSITLITQISQVNSKLSGNNSYSDSQIAKVIQSITDQDILDIIKKEIILIHKNDQLVEQREAAFIDNSKNKLYDLTVSDIREWKNIWSNDNLAYFNTFQTGYLSFINKLLPKVNEKNISNLEFSSISNIDIKNSLRRNSMRLLERFNVRKSLEGDFFDNLINTFPTKYIIEDSIKDKKDHEASLYKYKFELEAWFKLFESDFKDSPTDRNEDLSFYIKLLSETYLELKDVITPGTELLVSKAMTNNERAHIKDIITPSEVDFLISTIKSFQSMETQMKLQTRNWIVMTKVQFKNSLPDDIVINQWQSEFNKVYNNYSLYKSKVYSDMIRQMAVYTGEVDYIIKKSYPQALNNDDNNNESINFISNNNNDNNNSNNNASHIISKIDDLPSLISNLRAQETHSKLHSFFKVYLREQEGKTRFNNARVELNINEIKRSVATGDHSLYNKEFNNFVQLLEASFTERENDFDTFVENLSNVWDDIDNDLANAYLEVEEKNKKVLL